MGTHSPLQRQLIMDHYQNPQNSSMPDSYDIKTQVVNRSCGDEIEVFLSFNKKKQIDSINYQARGCALSIASASILSENEELKAMNLAEILELDQKFMEDLVGAEFSINRLKCVLLPLQAIQQGISEYDQEAAQHK